MGIKDVVMELRERVEKIGRELEPDEDWGPVAFFVTPETYEVMPVPRMFFHSASAKDVLAKMLGFQARRRRAQIVALVVMQWLLIKRTDELTQTEYNKLDRDGVSDHPDRQEVVGILAWGRGGEHSTYGFVRRGDGPPAIKEWTPMTFAAKNRFSGPIMEAIGGLN